MGIGRTNALSASGGGGVFDVYKIAATSPLTGYKATGYSSGTWTWADSTTSLSAGTATPVVNYAFAASGTTLIGDSIAFDCSELRSVITISGGNSALCGTWKQVEGTSGQGRIWLKTNNTTKIMWGSPTSDDGYGFEAYAGVEGWHIVYASDTNNQLAYLGNDTDPGDFASVDVFHGAGTPVITYEEWA